MVAGKMNKWWSVIEGESEQSLNGMRARSGMEAVVLKVKGGFNELVVALIGR